VETGSLTTAPSDGGMAWDIDEYMPLWVIGNLESVVDCGRALMENSERIFKATLRNLIELCCNASLSKFILLRDSQAVDGNTLFWVHRQ
jgi:hypothetical protein